MNIGASVRTGVKWLLLGNIGIRLLEFAFGVVLARLLVPADFGMIVTIAVFTGFVSIMSSGGMGQSLIRAKEVDVRDFTAVFTLQLAVGVIIYVCFFFTAPWIARLFEDPLYTDLVRVSALAFLMRPFAFVRAAWLSRAMDFRNRSMIDVIANLCSGIVSCLMAWFGMGVWSLTLSGLVGALAKNVMLARITGIRLHVNIDRAAMRRHSGYGFKITVNDYLSYLVRESKNLIVSKLAGAAALGLYNKSESLSRIPNQIFMSATMQPVFRALSMVQDDLVQTKQIFHRAITLLMAYTTPMYVGLWWVAKPLVEIVYGEKWLEVVEPLRILVVMGFFLNILGPCGVVLDAQNRLGTEMVALTVRLVVTVVACLLGLQWGLVGVAWAIVTTNIFGAVYHYVLVCRAIPTGLADLGKSMFPAVILNSLLFLALAAADYGLSRLPMVHSALYVLLMVMSGAVAYAAAFLLLPLPALRSEADRWRQKLRTPW